MCISYTKCVKEALKTIISVPDAFLVLKIWFKINLIFNLRKFEGEGVGVHLKLEVKLEENKGGEGGGLNLFSWTTNKKNLRY